MLLSLFLNSLLELYLSFCSGISEGNLTLVYLCVLCFLFFLVCFLVKLSSSTTVLKNEHTKKRQGRTKRRRKGGTLEGHRYHQREEEEKKELISILKSPLGQPYDFTRFRQMLCPDSSCEVCNNATAEMEQLLLSLVQEDATLSVSSLASTSPVTGPSFTQSPASSAIPSGDLIPSPLLELFPPLASVTPHNSVTSLGDFPLSPRLSQTLPPDPSLLESKFPVDPSPTQTLASPPLSPHDAQNEETPLTLNTILPNSSITQDINPLPDLAQALNPTDNNAPPALSISPPLDSSLTVTQTQPMNIPSVPILETSSPDGPVAMPTSGSQGIDHPSLPISDVSSWEPPVIDSLPSTLAQSDFNQEHSFKDVGYDSKKDPDSSLMSLSGENLRQSVSQSQQANALNIHLSKKFEEINERRLPETVRSSQHVMKHILSVRCYPDIRQRCLPPSVAKDCCLDTSQELCFLVSSAQQIMENHITKFNRRMLCGIPSKVLKCIETFKYKNTFSHASFNSNASSPNHLTSEVDSNTGSFTSLRGTSKSVHGGKVKIGKSAAILKVPLPTTSLVDKEEQGTLRHLPSDIPQGLAEEAPHSPVANIHPPMLHTSQTGAGHKPMNQSVKTMPSMSRAEELNDLQSDDKLKTNKPTISVKGTNELTTVTTERPSEKMSVHQNPNLELKKLLMAELKSRSEAGRPSQAQGQHSAMSHDSDRLTYKASLTPAQSVSGVDAGVSQVLYAQSEDRRISMKQRQEPWAPKGVLGLGRVNNFPPAIKKVNPTDFRPGERGGGDAEFGTPQAQRKKLFTHDVALEEMLGNKCSQTLSQKGQPPSESLFRNKIKYFFQWLLWRKSSPLPAQSRSPVKSTATFPGTMAFVRTDGKILEEKVGCWHATDVTCPQELLPSTVKCWKAQEKAAVWDHAGPVQGWPFKPRIPPWKLTNTKSCHQTAVFAGQSSTSTRKIRHEGGQPQNVVALKDQLLCQKHPQTVSCGGPMPHLSTTCSPQAAQGPPTALTSAVGTVFRQKTVLQNVQGKKLLPPNNPLLVENQCGKH